MASSLPVLDRQAGVEQQHTAPGPVAQRAVPGQRLRSGATRAPGYLNLLDVVSDDSMGTYFMLVFTFMMVRVRGVHLQSVILAIESGTAAFLQEFDGKRWLKPDPSMPFIESIEVLHEAMDWPVKKLEKNEEEAE